MKGSALRRRESGIPLLALLARLLKPSRLCAIRPERRTVGLVRINDCSVETEQQVGALPDIPGQGFCRWREEPSYGGTGRVADVWIAWGLDHCFMQAARMMECGARAEKLGRS